jgi:hypothetical protein
MRAMHIEKLHSAAPNLSFLLGLSIDPEANSEVFHVQCGS